MKKDYKEQELEDFLISKDESGLFDKVEDLVWFMLKILAIALVISIIFNAIK